MWATQSKSRGTQVSERRNVSGAVYLRRFSGVWKHIEQFTAPSNAPSNALPRMSGNFPDPVPRPSAKRDKDSVGRYHDIDAPRHADIALSLADLPIPALHVHSWLVDGK